MKCARCQKPKPQLQVYPNKGRFPYRVCDECYAELALNELERSREIRKSIQSWYVKDRGWPVIEESCHA